MMTIEEEFEGKNYKDVLVAILKELRAIREAQKPLYIVQTVPQITPYTAPPITPSPTPGTAPVPTTLPWRQQPIPSWTAAGSASASSPPGVTYTLNNGEQEVPRCTFMTAANMQCILADDHPHGGGHDLGI